MTAVVLVVVGCLYLAGILIAAGDAMIDEAHERDQAHAAKLDAVRTGSLARMHAARRRLNWCALWPLLLIQALIRLRHETRPRHQTPTPRHR